MKKIYILATALFFGAHAQAQQLIDFESFPLAAPVDTFDNGSAGNGDFLVDFATFTNFYDTAWGGYWSGFALSNMTDVTTPGIGNQYSSVTGTGADSSATYAMFYQSGTISVDFSHQLDSIKITNSTYAALSMRDGDSYGKKFGDTVDANGTPDGTFGEDFLSVWLFAEDLSGNNKDSLEFFLADYRFTDNTQDYILGTWKNIDLTVFNFSVQKLSFKMKSSDNGQFGMNTPAYFAVDNISTQITEGLDENTLNISVYPNPVQDILTVNGENGTITLTNMNGQVVYTAEHNGASQVDMSNFDKGVYLLRMSNENGSAIQRIIK